MGRADAPAGRARIHPLEARQMLARNIADGFTVVALTAADYDNAIRICAEGGWSGGRVYDALHIIAARRSECDVYTLNVRHFRDLAPDLNIRTP